MSKEKKNKNCIVDNNRFITEFECDHGTYEFYQVQPSVEAVKEYHAIGRAIKSDPLSIEAEIITDKVLKAEGDEKLKILVRLSELDKELGAKYDKDKALTYLAKQSFIGTDFQRGKITLKGDEIDNDFTKLPPLPALLNEKILLNAIKLISYTDDEVKN